MKCRMIPGYWVAVTNPNAALSRKGRSHLTGNPYQQPSGGRHSFPLIIRLAPHIHWFSRLVPPFSTAVIFSQPDLALINLSVWGVYCKCQPRTPPYIACYVWTALETVLKIISSNVWLPFPPYSTQVRRAELQFNVITVIARALLIRIYFAIHRNREDLYLESMILKGPSSCGRIYTVLRFIMLSLMSEFSHSQYTQNN